MQRPDSASGRLPRQRRIAALAQRTARQLRVSGRSAAACSCPPLSAMVRAVRIAAGCALVALANGQVQCGEPQPVYSPQAYATNNPNPSECSQYGAGGANLWNAMLASCTGTIPATYTGSQNGAGSTEAQCQADLCRAAPACTTAIENWGNSLEACNPQGNYMATLFTAKAWRDACVGEYGCSAAAARSQPPLLSSLTPCMRIDCHRRRGSIWWQQSVRASAATCSPGSRGVAESLRVSAAAGGHRLRHESQPGTRVCSPIEVVYC